MVSRRVPIKANKKLSFSWVIRGTLLRPPSDTTQKTAFDGLPTELLQYIASFLPPSAAASFALSAHCILHIIGSQHLHALHKKGSRSESIHLLEYLERDTPAYYACHRCVRFHRWKHLIGHKKISFYNDRHYLGPEYGMKCMLKDGCVLVFDEYRLMYHEVRLAVNYRRLGPGHGIPLDMFTRTYHFDDVWSAIDASVKAQIAGDELLVRITYQTTYHFEWERRFGLNKAFPGICPHNWFEGSHSKPTGFLYEIIQCRLLHRSNQFCEFCSGVQQCPSCATDFQVTAEFQATKKPLGPTITVTAWKNLGSGRTPFDLQWQAHVFKPGNTSQHATPWLFQPGRIKAVFDEQETRTEYTASSGTSQKGVNVESIVEDHADIELSSILTELDAFIKGNQEDVVHQESCSTFTEPEIIKSQKQTREEWVDSSSTSIEPETTAKEDQKDVVRHECSSSAEQEILEREDQNNVNYSTLCSTSIIPKIIVKDLRGDDYSASYPAFTLTEGEVLKGDRRHDDCLESFSASASPISGRTSEELIPKYSRRSRLKTWLGRELHELHEKLMNSFRTSGALRGYRKIEEKA